MKTTNENEVQNKRSFTKGFIAIACVCALALTGVFAYLTATDSVKNIFGFTDELDIEVVEPNWDPDNAQNLLPTQSVTKDPALHNPNKVDVYVFADVVIPQKDIVTANADGTLNESAVVDLFSFESNDGWTLKETIPGDDGNVTYRYVYNDVVAAGETSGSIFDKVAIVNYVNEQFNTEELAQQIVINGYGIQAAGFANADEAYASHFGESVKTFVADITVNDDSITAGSEYEVKQVETLSTASISTAAIDDQVIFEDVSLIEDAKYAIVPAGASVEEAIAEFTADKEKQNEATVQGVVTLGNDLRSSFAIYSADDESLTFYKRKSVPAAGESFQGKTVTNVFTGFETDAYTVEHYGSGYDQADIATTPWSSIAWRITTVTIEDADIAPKSLAAWFHGFTRVSAINGLDKIKGQNVTSMDRMFGNCFALTSVDLSGFNTANVQSMLELFSSCTSLASIKGIEDFDTSSVTNMGGLFMNTKVSSLDLTRWNTDSVTNMTRMFSGCSDLAVLDLSSFNTSAVTNMYAMFDRDYALKTIYVGNGWSVNSLSDPANSMFADCTSIIGGSGTVFDSEHIDAPYAHIDGGSNNPGYFTAK